MLDLITSSEIVNIFHCDVKKCNILEQFFSNLAKYVLKMCLKIMPNTMKNKRMFVKIYPSKDTIICNLSKSCNI